MKNNLLGILALTLCFYTLSAQTTAKDKYYFGVDLHWIWSDDYNSPSLQFKCIDAKRRKDGSFSGRQGYRIALYGWFEKQPNISPAIPSLVFPRFEGMAGLSYGHEWHKEKGLFDFFWGGDVGISFRGNSGQVYWEPIVGNTWDRYIFWSKSAGLSVGPMGGLSIRIIDGLHVGLETSMWGTVTREKYYVTYNSQPTETDSDWGFRMRFNPVSNLNVLFSFR